MFLRKKTSLGKRSSLRLRFDEDGSLNRIDYKGINALNNSSFMSIQGNEVSKFKLALYELGTRGLISSEDVFKVAEKIKELELAKKGN